MQIVIDIPEVMYDWLDTGFSDEYDAKKLWQVVKNGIQLPKGHGRLIDADALMEYCQNGKSKAIDCNDIARFPTIIRREDDNKNI